MEEKERLAACAVLTQLLRTLASSERFTRHLMAQTFTGPEMDRTLRHIRRQLRETRRLLRELECR